MVNRSEPSRYEGVFPNNDLIDIFQARQVDPDEIDPQFASANTFGDDDTEIPIDREVVHADDRRKLATDTMLDPFRYVCQVIGTKSGNTHGKAGSGFIINSRTVLTAAHNLWLGERSTQPSDWIDLLMVYPGLSGNRNGNGVLARAVESSVPHPNYVNYRDPRFDFALLHLAEPLPAGFGSLPLIAVNPADLRNHLALISGYPFKEPRSSAEYTMPQCNQYYDVGLLVPHDGLVKYFADTTEGQSGCPVIVITKDQYNRDVWTGVAVHIEGCISTGNKAAPITPFIHDFIRANS